MECSVSFGADAFTVDGVAALRCESYSLREVADSGVVEVPDGDPVSFGMVGKIVRRLKAEPGWRGERVEGSGRPRETAEVEDKALARLSRGIVGKRRPLEGRPCE